MNRSLTLKDKKQLVLNSDIELGEQEGNGKGRYFMSRFIEPGIAHYEELGDILITKETLNKFIQTMVGVPVIIDHEDVTDKNVDKLRVGSVSKVWFNEFDGYFYCEGILTDPEAIDLVKNQGWNVSCAYSFQSVPKDTHNGKKIDMEFTDGEFLHLAIVKNPRYEGANIVVNKNDDDLEWITVKGNHIPIKKGQSEDEAVKEFLESKQSDAKDKSGDGGKKEDKNKEKINKYIQHYKASADEIARETGLSMRDAYEKLKEMVEAKEIEYDQKNDLYYKLQKGETKEHKEEYKVPEELNKFERESAKDKSGASKANNSIGDITMQVLNELKEFIKSVVSNEKDEEMKEVKNEDKRKLIDEVGGILKGKVDEEVWRTIIGKLEKVAYEPSEDSKADNEDDKAKNKCKNEDEEKEEKVTENEEDKKEDKKEETENEDEDEDKKEDKKEVKNSMKDIVMGGNGQAQKQKLYVSRKERLEEGNKY